MTGGADYLSTVRPEHGRHYQSPVRTGLCKTLPETLDAGLVQEEEAEAKAEAEKARPGLTMFTDGPQTYDEATGYAAVFSIVASVRPEPRTGLDCMSPVRL